MEREKFVRPQDVAIIVTSDPKVMLGKYLPKRVVKTWVDDYRDDDPCIPVHYSESQVVSYFKVQVRTKWIEGEKMNKSDVDYIVASQEVGEAKSLVESVLAYENEKNKREKLDGEEVFIRKAIPFSVDYIVPKEYSELYKEEPSN